MRAIVEGWADPAIAPYIEPDQTENLILRHKICYYTINPTEMREEVVETKVGPNDLATLMRAKVNDEIIVRSTVLGLAGGLVKQDIIWPDMSKG